MRKKRGLKPRRGAKRQFGKWATRTRRVRRELNASMERATIRRKARFRARAEKEFKQSDRYKFEQARREQRAT